MEKSSHGTDDGDSKAGIPLIQRRKNQFLMIVARLEGLAFETVVKLGEVLEFDKIFSNL